jgi:hypothetical protein
VPTIQPFDFSNTSIKSPLFAAKKQAEKKTWPGLQKKKDSLFYEAQPFEPQRGLLLCESVEAIKMPLRQQTRRYNHDRSFAHDIVQRRAQGG